MDRCSQRGQTTLAMAGVLAIAVLLGTGLVAVTGAMVNRTRARAAADAVALAAVQDQSAADDLVTWYGERDVTVSAHAGQAASYAGSSQALAWAVSAEQNRPMPALVAILARARQLVGDDLALTRVDRDRILAAPGDDATLRRVAAELGLCGLATDGSSAGAATFALC